MTCGLSASSMLKSYSSSISTLREWEFSVVSWECKQAFQMSSITVLSPSITNVKGWHVILWPTLCSKDTRLGLRKDLCLCKSHYILCVTLHYINNQVNKVEACCKWRSCKCENPQVWGLCIPSTISPAPIRVSCYIWLITLPLVSWLNSHKRASA